MSNSNLSLDGLNIGEMTSSNKRQDEGISVQLIRRAVLTLKTGRCSKHLILVGEEAMRREKRRARNRAAAKKLKEKRHMIEDELMKKIEELENQHSDLQNYLDQLQQRKQHLFYELNNVLLDEIDQLLTDDTFDSPSIPEQHSNHMNLADEAVEQIINSYLSDCFDSVIEIE